MNTTTITNNKFDSLILVENGLILKYGKKRKKEISFSELDKIYIKSHKLNPIIEFVFILLPFLFVLLSVEYIPFDFIIFLALFTIAPVFMKVKKYKWYQLNVLMKDGTFFKKKLSSHMKTQNVSILEKVQKECLHFNFNANLLATV